MDEFDLPMEDSLIVIVKSDDVTTENLDACRLELLDGANHVATTVLVLGALL